MSTLAAARADNFYFGPNYDPNGGSLKYQRKMKLKGPYKPSRLDKYKIKSGPKIRFETPFHVKCKCGHMIAKGVRFNAAKKEIGHFHSTIILQFTMLCPACKIPIVCKTDPENCDYVYTEGAVRILDTSKATDMEFIEDPEEKKKKLLNAMYKLETKAVQVKQESLNPVIEELIDYRMQNWKNDFDNNLILRKKFREEKAKHEAIEAERTKVKNFALPMEDLSQAELVYVDIIKELIKDVKFKQTDTKQQQRNKRLDIMNTSILPSQKLSNKEQQQLEGLYKKMSNLPAATRKSLKAALKQQSGNSFKVQLT